MAYSREVHALIRLIRSFGVPHRITDINGPGHTRTSYHYARGTGGKGTAIDIAGPVPYRADPAGAAAAMQVICALLEPYESRIAELICSHLDYSVKNGKRVGRYAVASHWNHIHLAVRPRVFLYSPDPTPEVTVVPDNPDLPNIEGPLTFHPVINTTTGECRGYYIFGTMTGEVHGHGDGAPYFGRSEDITPDDEQD